jgi:hypothetical protein
MRPVYIDGPLEGREFDTNDAFVRYPDVDSPLLSKEMVTYQFQQFGFHKDGKKGVLVWIGWCSPGKPETEVVAKALLKPEVFDRADIRAMPEDLTR